MYKNLFRDNARKQPFHNRRKSELNELKLTAEIQCYLAGHLLHVFLPGWAGVWKGGRIPGKTMSPWITLD
jgi:hypothetical protein